MSIHDDEIPSHEDCIEPIANLGAMILCGGRSHRMGMDKSQLVFDNMSFLECIFERVSQVSNQIVVVQNTTQTPVNQLPGHVLLEHDEQANQGPLEGIRVGLRRLAEIVDYAFVTSCDVPLLNPELIRHLFCLIGDYPAIVPVDGGRVYGTTAIYRTDLHPQIGERIQAGQLRVSELANAFGARLVPTESLIEVDPKLDSMMNVNSAADYFRLLERFGQTCPSDLEAQLIRKHS